MTPFKLKIITPEKTFFNGETTQIIAKTTMGNVGILHGHVPYVANLVSSPMLIEVDGELKEAALSGGSKQNAEERMKRHESQKEFDRAEKKLKRALNRLMVADKKH